MIRGTPTSTIHVTAAPASIKPLEILRYSVCERRCGRRAHRGAAGVADPCTALVAAEFRKSTRPTESRPARRAVTGTLRQPPTLRNMPSLPWVPLPPAPKVDHLFPTPTLKFFSCVASSSPERLRILTSRKLSTTWFCAWPSGVGIIHTMNGASELQKPTAFAQTDSNVT